MAIRKSLPMPIVANGVALIPLTRGMHAKVDMCDLHIVSKMLWRACHCRGRFHASSGSGQNGHVAIQMHRLIMNAPTDRQVDHINGDGLDNRRCNLRLCTNAENARNRRLGASNTSGFKGVHYVRHLDKWEARIMLSGERFSLGCFANATDAARAYNDAAIKMFGEFARLNGGV